MLAIETTVELTTDSTTAAPILPAVPTVKTSPVFMPAETKLTVPLVLLIVYQKINCYFPEL